MKNKQKDWHPATKKMYVQYRFLYLIPTRNKITVYTSKKCVKNKEMWISYDTKHETKEIRL
jgi:hypothetical protein